MVRTTEAKVRWSCFKDKTHLLPAVNWFRTRNNHVLYSAFTLADDLQVFFAEHSEVNAAVIARKSGINPSLLRQCSSGHKHPSKDRSKMVKEAIHSFAKELLSLVIVV